VLVTPALRMTAFGGFAPVSDEGALGAAAVQRRPLAVLALVAAAGEAGVSREKILALLRPDAEPERARRTLTQTLYSLRRATGAEELFLGVTDIRLNPAAVECDVLAFDAALRQGRLADAVELYRGPFLDGFQLPGADEFERWAEDARERYAHRCADALRELARRAERAGDVATEVGWGRRLVALDPLDSAATLALVDALGRAGDAPGAQRR
jgi:DNA-binding SARP family transcriptional activator